MSLLQKSGVLFDLIEQAGTTGHLLISDFINNQIII